MGDRRPGMNDRLPCGTDTARRRHLARGEDCPVCGTNVLIPDPSSREEVDRGGARLSLA